MTEMVRTSAGDPVGLHSCDARRFQLPFRRQVILPVLAFVTVSCSAAGANDWEDLYMAHFAGVTDIPGLKARGINVVLQNVTHDPANWRALYDAAVKQKIRLIPILWGVDQAAWQWDAKQREWELDIGKYPDGVGPKFLQFLRSDARYLAATFALYSFHEPHNPETSEGMVDAERLRKFWRQIHEELFPGNRLKIYGESVAWHRDCRNGCVDYDALSLYPFATVKGESRYRPLHWAGGKGIGGMQIWPGPPTADRERAMENGRSVIDRFHQSISTAPAAPDGSRTKIIVLIQTYAIDGRADLWNRMPTAQEMVDWGGRVAGERKRKLAGMSWYCYRKAAAFYSRCLADERRDETGRDRLEAVEEVGRLLLGNTAPAASAGPEP